MPASDNIISFHLFKLFTALIFKRFLRTSETERKAKSRSGESVESEPNTTTPAGGSSLFRLSDSEKLVLYFHDSLAPPFNLLSAFGRYWRRLLFVFPSVFQSRFSFWFSMK